MRRTQEESERRNAVGSQADLEMKAMEEGKKRAEEEAQQARDEMKALREEMMNLKTAVTRQPVSQPVASSPNAAAAEMMAAQMKAQMDMQMQMMKQQQMMGGPQSPMKNGGGAKSAAEIELEKMKEEKRQAEMKALKDEMMAMRQSGAGSPEVKALKDEMMAMRLSAKREQEELREKLSGSLGGTSTTVDISSDPGLATVRR